MSYRTMVDFIRGDVVSMHSCICQKLKTDFSPVYMEVVDESHGHNVPEGAESHFKVVMVSEVFEGKMPVRRHQAVYTCLQEELAGSVHALALHLYTSGEWDKQGSAPDSPQCMGGSKSDS